MDHALHQQRSQTTSITKIAPCQEHMRCHPSRGCCDFPQVVAHCAALCEPMHQIARRGRCEPGR
eukprot:5680573-Amphidinium_carterae.1